MNFEIVIVLFALSCCSTFVEVKSDVPLLTDFEGITGSLRPFLSKNDKLALFLDYDGTLSPFVDDPKKAFMEPESQAAINSLGKMSNVFLSIVSGRAADDARNKVQLNIIYAGNHGLEIFFPNKPTFQRIDQKSMASFAKMDAELNKRIKGISKKAVVENKKYSLTVHYRNVTDVNLHPEIVNQCFDIIQSFGWKPNQAIMAVEAKPNIAWNKGKAILHILNEEFGKNWAKKVKVVFIGDDTTDEDAMLALKGIGRTFRVTHGKPNIETHADFCVPSTKTVSLILQSLQTIMN